MNIAVIMTACNRAGALAAVFEGYRAQRDRAFEIVVADHGYGSETGAGCLPQAGAAYRFGGRFACGDPCRWVSRWAFCGCLVALTLLSGLISLGRMFRE